MIMLSNQYRYAQDSQKNCFLAYSSKKILISVVWITKNSYNFWIYFSRININNIEWMCACEVRIILSQLLRTNAFVLFYFPLKSNSGIS